MRRWGEILKSEKFISLSPQLLTSLSAFLSRERHLASVIAEKTNDWSEKDHEDKVEGAHYGGVRPSPEDQDSFKNEKKN